MKKIILALTGLFFTAMFSCTKSSNTAPASPLLFGNWVLVNEYGYVHEKYASIWRSGLDTVFTEDHHFSFNNGITVDTCIQNGVSLPIFTSGMGFFMLGLGASTYGISASCIDTPGSTKTSGRSGSGGYQLSADYRHLSWFWLADAIPSTHIIHYDNTLVSLYVVSVDSSTLVLSHDMYDSIAPSAVFYINHTMTYKRQN